MAMRSIRTDQLPRGTSIIVDIETDDPPARRKNPKKKKGNPEKKTAKKKTTKKRSSGTAVPFSSLLYYRKFRFRSGGTVYQRISGRQYRTKSGAVKTISSVKTNVRPSKSW